MIYFLPYIMPTVSTAVVFQIILAPERHPLPHAAGVIGWTH